MSGVLYETSSPKSVKARCFLKMLSQSCEKRLLASSCLSVCPSTLRSSAPAGQIFIKYDVIVFFENLSRQFQVSLIRDQNNSRSCTCRLCTFMIVPCSVLPTIRNASNKTCRENQTPHFRLSNFFSENPTVSEIRWTNMAEENRPKMTVFHMAHVLPQA